MTFVYGPVRKKNTLNNRSGFVCADDIPNITGKYCSTHSARGKELHRVSPPYFSTVSLMAWDHAFFNKFRSISCIGCSERGSAKHDLAYFLLKD